jgi:hypothetical protein
MVTFYYPTQSHRGEREVLHVASQMGLAQLNYKINKRRHQSVACTTSLSVVVFSAHTARETHSHANAVVVVPARITHCTLLVNE